ncbi:MAG: hypothetical protein GXX92_02000 [Clostridiales bacterium]|nr:hypothetical protein [Clostridiales bacterium]
MSSMYAFHGADGKTGTTMITQSIAEIIASSRKELKILVVSMHGRPGTDYVDRVCESIEGIRLHLENRLLDTQRLMEGCRIRDNLYMLGGVESIEQVRGYHPHMAAYLLESMKDAFDLILTDTGNDIDNGLAVGALEYIGNNYCILAQQETIISRYEKVKPLYDRLGICFSSYIVNKYTDQDPYDLHYIGKRLCLDQEKLMKVAVSGYERQAESDHRTLLSYKSEEFSNDIQLIANHVLTRAQIPTIDHVRKKKWMPFI